MTSLTRAKKMTRAFALGGGAFLVLFIVFRVVISAVSLISTDPTQQAGGPLINMTFGQIAPPVLPKANVMTETATLELDLVSGNYPQATSSAHVYKVGNAALSLSARDRARSKATNLGFTVEPTEPTPSTFRWEEGGRTMELDLSDQTFALKRDISSITFNNRQQFSRFTPIGTLTSQFLRQQFQYADLQYNSPEVQFVNPSGATFTPQSDNAVEPTNYARATFLRQNLDGLPIYSSHGKFGPLSIVIIPATIKENERNNQQGLEVDQVAALENNYIPIQQDQSATYPVITPQTAFSLLQNNLKNYLVAVDPINNTIAPSSFMSGRVLFVTLVYLEPDEKNRDYVQPVWMFEGRGTTDIGNARWIAYVPAIDQARVNSILLSK